MLLAGALGSRGWPLPSADHAYEPSHLLVALALSAFALAGCGGSAAPRTRHQREPPQLGFPPAAQTRASEGAATSRASQLSPAVLAARAAARPSLRPAREPDSFVLIGGLSASDTSTSEVYVGDLKHVSAGGDARHRAARRPGARCSTARCTCSAAAPSPSSTTSSASTPRATRSRPSAACPSAQSDVAVASIGNTAYVVGGYDGVSWKQHDPRLHAPARRRTKVVGTLPVGLRYAAVTAIDGRVLIAGGSTPTAASRAIFSFDPETRPGHADRDAATARDPWRTGPAWPVRVPGGWSGERYELPDRAHLRDQPPKRQGRAGRSAASRRFQTPRSCRDRRSLLLIGGLESSGAVETPSASSRRHADCRQRRSTASR